MVLKSYSHLRNSIGTELEDSYVKTQFDRELIPTWSYRSNGLVIADGAVIRNRAGDQFELSVNFESFKRMRNLAESKGKLRTVRATEENCFLPKQNYIENGVIDRITDNWAEDFVLYKFKNGLELLRTSMPWYNHSRLIRDYYSDRNIYFEVPLEVRKLLKDNLPKDSIRNIISFLSPCASKSIFVWNNVSKREDAVNGHILSVTSLKRFVEIDFLNPKDEQSGKLAKSFYDHLNEDPIDGPACFLDQKLVPCFGEFENYMIQSAKVMKIKNKMMDEIISEIESKVMPFSRTKLKNMTGKKIEIKRFELNKLFYAAYFFRINARKRYWGACSKYPEYDKTLKEIYDKVMRYKQRRIEQKEQANVNWKKFEYLRKQLRPGDPDCVVKDWYFSGALKNLAGTYNYPDEGFVRREYKRMGRSYIDRRLKSMKLIEGSILKTCRLNKSFLSRKTWIRFPDGTLAQARDLLRRDAIKCVNRVMVNYNEDVKKLLAKPVESYIKINKRELLRKKFYKPYTYDISKHRIQKEMDDHTILEQKKYSEMMAEINRLHEMFTRLPTQEEKDFLGIYEETGDY